MLRKLLKYDFRAYFKVFPYVWLGALLLAGFSRLLTSLPSESLSKNLAVAVLTATTTFSAVMMLVGLSVFTLIYITIRYYNGLLRNEGYLMFTLPTRPVNLLLSKLITSVCISLLTTAVTAVGVWLLVVGSDILKELTKFMGILSNAIVESEIASPATLRTLGILGALFSMIEQITQIFLAGAVGNLANRHKLLYGILTFLGINFVKSLLVQNGLILMLAEVSKGGISEVALGWIAVAVSALLSVLYFWLTELILRKHLNLE